MGLDIYLYRYEDFADTKRREDIYEKESEAIWAAIADRNGRKYEQLTEAEKDGASAKTKALAVSLELGEYGSDEARKTKIELPSKTDPEHLFKIGYFRSSYNDGGINHILRQHCGRDLSDIVVPQEGESHEDYAFHVQWRETRARALGDRNLMADKFASEGALQVVRVMDVGRGEAEDDEGAMRIYRAEVVKNKGRDNGLFGGGSYSNGVGYFNIDKPMTVRAIIHGKGRQHSFLPGMPPDTYLVIENEDGLSWYLKAMDIIVETCDYVLALPPAEQEKHYVHWSG